MMEFAGRRLKALGAVALSATLVLSVAACSSKSSGGGGGSSDSNNSGSLPATVNIWSSTDLTGAPAFAGTSQVKGAQLAIEQINSQKFLGNTKLALSSHDTANTPTTAASQISEAVADKSVSAILGTVSSNQSPVVAPLAQAGEKPILFTQSGSDGTVIGNYTYRVTAPMQSYYADKALSYLKTKNYKSVAVIYVTSSPTLVELGKNTIPNGASKYGYKVTSSQEVAATTADFSAVIQKALADKPDVVAPLLIGAANATFATQLRQAGFSGPVMANAGASSGNLKNAGASANGWFWPTDFSYLDATAGSSKKFVDEYKAKYNENPLNYAAEGYDSIWMIARALKDGGSADPKKLNTALGKIAKSGFEGALGKLTFENVNGGYDLRVAGVLVGWDGTNNAEILVK